MQYARGEYRDYCRNRVYSRLGLAGLFRIKTGFWEMFYGVNIMGTYIAFPHGPDHSRLKIFKNLSETLDFIIFIAYVRRIFNRHPFDKLRAGSMGQG